MSTPIIPWMGGKRRLVDRLIPVFAPHECYVEVFAGGAALYFMRRQDALVDCMRRYKGRVMVSINDHPDIRRVFEGYPLHHDQSAAGQGLKCQPCCGCIGCHSENIASRSITEHDVFRFIVSL